MEVDPPSPASIPASLPDLGQRRRRNHIPDTLHDWTGIQKDLQKFGSGIIRPAPTHSQPGRIRWTRPPPNLVAKAAAERLLQSYYHTMHSSTPIVHWPTFTGEFEDAYRAGSYQAMSMSWTSVFFGVLALGALHIPDSVPQSRIDNAELGEIAKNLWEVETDHYNINHAQAGLLRTVFLLEMNRKSTAYVALGTTVRIAQDLGLQYESSLSQTFEGDMRKRVWWSIYICDRCVSRTSCG